MEPFKDILTHADLPAETRVFLELRRKRKETDAKASAYRLMTNPEIAHAVAGWPERVAIGEGER